MDYVQTKHEEIFSEKICSYCGKTCRHEYEIEDYERYDYYFCDCEGAKTEIEIQRLRSKLQEFLKNGDKILNPRRYKAEAEKNLRDLKKKYRIV